MTDYGFDEPRRDFGINCIAVTAQSSHTGGSPMSQRECAGFNWPPLSISASEPVSISPEAVSRCGPVIFADCVSDWPVIPGVMPVPARSPSEAAGVDQPASGAERGRSRGFVPLPAEFRWSRTTGVCQPARCVAIAVRVSNVPRPHRAPEDSPSSVRGVGHPASVATAGSNIDPEPGRFTTAKSGPACFAIGVGRPERSVADVRRAEARSRERRTPEGVTHSFHVSLYKVEPRIDVAARNLLANDVDRAALLDEPLPSGPKVPLVTKPASFACRAERLAWAGTGPDRSIVGPTGAAQGVGPHSNSGEEMALNISRKLIWSNIADIPFIDDAGCNVTSGYEFAQPCRSEGVDLVVVGTLPTHFPNTRTATRSVGEVCRLIMGPLRMAQTMGVDSRIVALVGVLRRFMPQPARRWAGRTP